jgi:hypothetical protein
MARSPSRITARKYMGNDAGSWAVFIDGRPMVTGLTRDEVPYYKKEAQAILDRHNGKDK